MFDKSTLPGRGRSLFVRAAVFLPLLFSPNINAKDVTVFEVRKNLALTENEPVYKDYYLNGGTESGLRPGIVVTIRRRKSIYDSYSNSTFDDLKVPVGRLKIIHSQKGLSVAREHSLYNRKQLPVLDHDFIMVGDRLDLSTAKMEAKKTANKVEKVKRGRKTANSKKKTDIPSVAADFASQIPTPVEEPKDENETLQGPSLK